MPKRPRRGGKPNPPIVPKAAYSIDEFCVAYGISRSTFYALRRTGHGPREMKVGGRWLISLEAAQAWNRAREQY